MSQLRLEGHTVILAIDVNENSVDKKPSKALK